MPFPANSGGTVFSAIWHVKLWDPGRHAMSRSEPIAFTFHRSEHYINNCFISKSRYAKFLIDLFSYAHVYLTLLRFHCLSIQEKRSPCTAAFDASGTGFSLTQQGHYCDQLQTLYRWRYSKLLYIIISVTLYTFHGVKIYSVYKQARR